MAPPFQVADVFISHAWEDKEEIARPLAEALRRQGLTVWYDEYVLRLGDSLRQVIDKGLSSSRLSPAFFSKEWPQRELNGLLARETAQGTKVLLPVWHKITAEEVAKVSPLLADKLAVSTARGLNAVVRQILDVFEAEGTAREAKLVSQPVLLPKSPAAPSAPVAQESPKNPPRQNTASATAKTPTPEVKVFEPSKATRGSLFSVRRLVLSGVLLLLVILGIWALQRWPHAAAPDRGQTLPSADSSNSLATRPEEQEQHNLESPAQLAQNSLLKQVAEGQRIALQGQLRLLQDYTVRQQIGFRLLVGIATSLPELLWLDQVSLDTEEVSIKGRSFNTNAVANFIENLDRMKGISEPTLDMTEKVRGDIYGFRLTMGLEADPVSGTTTDSTLVELKAECDALLRRFTPYGEADAAMSQVHELLGQAGRAETLMSGAPVSHGNLIDTFTVTGRVHDISSRELALLLERLGNLSRIVSVRRLTITAGSREAVADLVLEIPVLKKGVKIPQGRKAMAAPTDTIKLAWPASKRGLFKSLLAEPPGAAATDPCPEGFAGLLIDELELRGIWRTTKGFVAQVYAQSKAKTYLLKEGDQICDGDVVSISRTELVMKQIVNDPAAPKPFREVVLALKAP